MKSKITLKSFLLIFVFSLMYTNSYSQDQNLHIYLCFGQSNMEGQGAIEKQDLVVNERFKTLQALDCSNLTRTKDSWYTAVPPTCQCYSKLSPADYFGRTMIANLPDSIIVAVINVSIGGCDIRLFDKDIYEDYDSTYVESWFLDKIKSYGGNPYQHLIDLANLAQKDGVIKGILLHQGETNTGDVNWPSYVKKIYNDMLTDLALEAESVPLLAGELVHEDQGGGSASHNAIIANLPDTIPTAYVVSSSGCTKMDDWHFNSDGYRELGRRYAVTMMTSQGVEMTQGSATTSLYYEAECGDVGDNWDVLIDTKASNESFISPKPDLEFISEPSTDLANAISIPFSIEKEGYFDIFARAKGKTSSQDSYWVKIDEGDFNLVEGLRTSSWQWFNIANAELSEGNHTLTISIAENSTMLDKININNFLYALSGEGDEAENICIPDTTSVGISTKELNKGFILGQSYPNPGSGLTSIDFEITNSDFVSLKIYSMLGQEIMEIAGHEYGNGKHTASFNASNLTDGVYFYTLRVGAYTESKKMVIKSN